MPMRMSRYPPDWDQIACDYKCSIGWKCEKCGIGHLKDGTMGSCLTVHHPNHDPENPNAELKGLCARCHLNEERFFKYDLKHRDQLLLFFDQSIEGPREKQ